MKHTQYLLCCRLAVVVPALAATALPVVYAEEPERIVVVGSRVTPRAVYDSNVPVDVITSEQIARTHISETSVLIQTLVPSFNFSVSTVSDGTDAVRPANLRGLYPDQLLVLVNGKRRHNSALVHVNGSVGRGSAGVDLNAIPPSAIERIEVLRDGAAAQYGSDAIAGIINIVLKEQTEYSEAQAYYGETYQGDGGQRRYSANLGIGLQEDGFLNLSVERRDRDPTNRAGKDGRCQYSNPKDNGPSFFADGACTVMAGKEAAFDRVSHRIGDAESDNDYVFFNAMVPFGGVAELYAFGGLAKRETEAGGFYRRPADRRNRPNVYPDGFLPLIETDIDDNSLAAGVRFDLFGWDTDASLHWGENTFDFAVKNSLNVSIGDDSPASAESGGLRFDQVSLRLDATRHFDTGGLAFDLATGYEYRRDGYRIRAGEPDSYRDGGEMGQDNTPGTPGIQVFPGFRPENQVNERRHNHSLYVDAESQLTERLSAAVAARWEDYSDFGTDLNGKLSMRHQTGELFALRGAISSGFRAPSLPQQYFNNVSTQFRQLKDGTNAAFETLTAPNDSGFVRALGVDALSEESSVNMSFGVVANPLPNLNLSADVYRIKVRDRIVLSSSFNKDKIASDRVAAANAALMAEFGIGLDRLGEFGSFQFFTNAIDTVTRGLDIIGDYRHPLANGAEMKYYAALNFTSTRADDDADTVDGLVEGAVLFNATEEAHIEKGSPRQSGRFSVNYDDGANDVIVRANHYGGVFVVDGAQRQHFGSRWLFDVEYTRSVTADVDWTIGALNVLDTRPERNNEANTSAGGAFVYNRRSSPFGFNGGFYFTSVKMYF